MTPADTTTAAPATATRTAPLTLVGDAVFRRILDARIAGASRVALLATACRINALTMIMRAGSGHIGSSFSAMELFVHLLHRELDTLRRPWSDPDRDVFFSSKGHDVPGLYAVLNALGALPVEDLLRLRRIDGPCGHPDVRCPMMETTTGSLGMGISKGKGMALARRVNGRTGRIVVMIGDGELQEGQCWEAVHSAAAHRVDNLLVVVDHNHVQSERPVEATMPVGEIGARIAALGWAVAHCDGHDPDAIAAALRTLDGAAAPKLLVADTRKGCGVSFMEHPAALAAGGGTYPWHAGAPAPDAYARAIEELLARLEAQCEAAGLAAPEIEHVPPHAAAPRPAATANLVSAYGRTLEALGDTHRELVVLDADLAGDCGLRGFARRFPQRFFEHGIAEQDMVSTAGGLARQGLLPVVNSFAAFLASRANEQIYLNACDGARVIYTLAYAGLTPAGPGPTHQSLRDVSLLAATPGVLVVQPSCEEEVEAALRFAVTECTESVALRLQLGPAPVVALPEAYTFAPGRGVALTSGDDALLFAYGPVMLGEALDAAQRLHARGLGLRVVNMPWLNHVDIAWLAATLDDHTAVYVLEDHARVGGLGDMLREAITALHATGRTRARAVETLGVAGLPAWGTPAEVLAAHELDSAAVARRVLADLAG